MSDHVTALQLEEYFCRAYGLSKSDRPCLRGSDHPCSLSQLRREPSFQHRWQMQLGQAKPPHDQERVWATVESYDATYSLAGTLDGHIPGTLVEEDACSFSSGTEGEPKYLCPGSLLYVFKLRGEKGYEHFVTRRLYYVPTLPLPLVITQEDFRREGYYVNCWKGGRELRSIYDDTISIELVNARAPERGPCGWEVPDPFTNVRWLEVEPINDVMTQTRLLRMYEEKLAQEAARTAAWERGRRDEDEIWEEGDGAWGWNSWPTSPSYSPQPSPEPE